jgi:hypothetical protein
VSGSSPPARDRDPATDVENGWRVKKPSPLLARLGEREPTPRARRARAGGRAKPGRRAIRRRSRSGGCCPFRECRRGWRGSVRNRPPVRRAGSSAPAP